ncbi:MAG: hypothetical protein IPO21_15890 [Bacteroidales bacterium]|nr:hypothetical protein [Bacteroidales bacterium]
MMLLEKDIAKHGNQLLEIFNDNINRIDDWILNQNRIQNIAKAIGKTSKELELLEEVWIKVRKLNIDPVEIVNASASVKSILLNAGLKEGDFKLLVELNRVATNSGKYAGQLTSVELEALRNIVRSLHKKCFEQSLKQGDKIWKVIKIADFLGEYHLKGTNPKSVGGSITLVGKYSETGQADIVDILGLDYVDSPYKLGAKDFSDGFVRIEANATMPMQTNSFTPFDLTSAQKAGLGPPQTFTGLAGSANSEHLVPELYLTGFQQIEKGSIATRYNYDGTISKVPSTNNPSKLVDGIYELDFDINNNLWKWKTVD